MNINDNPARPRRVLLSTDCGADMDDQWALALLAISPEVDLCGVVTTHAILLKINAEATTREARAVLANIPRPNPKIPVVTGSSQPLENKTTPQRNAGIDFILMAAEQHSPQDRLAVLCIGATTDVASALLLDPTLGDRIEIVAMGFCGWPDPGQEFNILADRLAWQVLLESRAPITVGDQKVCFKDLMMTPDRAYALFDPAGPPGHYLAKILDDFIARDPDGLATLTGRRGYWPIWDCVTVAQLLGLARHETHPRPALNDEMQFIHGAPAMARRTIDWITDVDSEKMWSLFVERLRLAQD